MSAYNLGLIQKLTERVEKLEDALSCKSESSGSASKCEHVYKEDGGQCTKCGKQGGLY